MTENNSKILVLLLFETESKLCRAISDYLSLSECTVRLKIASDPESPPADIFDAHVSLTDSLAVAKEMQSRCDRPCLLIGHPPEKSGGAESFPLPFHLQDLLARIRVLAHPSQEKIAHSGRTESCRFNGFFMNPDSYQLFAPDGSLVPLTSGEFSLLKAFVRAPRRVLSRSFLFDVTRDGGSEPFDRAIDVQVNRLRSKLKDPPKSPEIIQTVRGVGYMFIGTLE